MEFVTPPELLLLEAALLEGPSAAAAAEKWIGALSKQETENGFKELGRASRRLLPLVYRNTKGFLADGLRDAIRPIHHEYWADNQKRLCRLQELLPWFEEKGVPTLILKGMALSVLHYRDMALRPMSDLDILVPEHSAQDVVERLLGEGWSSVYYLPSASRKRYFYRHTHAFPLEHPHYGCLDLHWHVLAEATFKDADLPFWQDSVPLAVNKIRSRALNPTDQLIHACVHGFTSNVVSPIRWIADAIVILRNSDIDWTRLVRLARELHITLPLAACLTFLRARFSTQIPEETTGELTAIVVDDAERRYFGTLLHENSDWRDVLAYNLERHRRANRDRHPIVGIGSLPRQLQLHYSLPHLRDLGAFAFSRLRTQIRKRTANS